MQRMMLKKICVLMLALLMLFALFGCRSEGVGMDVPTVNQTPATTDLSSSPTVNIQESGAAATVPPESLKPWEGQPIIDPSSFLNRLSADQQLQILEAYCSRYNITDVPLQSLCLRVVANVGECYAIFVDGFMYAQAITSETVGGLTFWYSCYQKMYIYGDGAIYTLQEAYAAEVISREDLQTIFDRYYGAYPHLWALYYNVDE